MRFFTLMLILSVFLLNGCNTEKRDDLTIIDYEYLSEEDEFPKDVTQWLMRMESNDGRVHSLTLEEGVMYVYAEQFQRAKVSYISEKIEGKTNESMKVTLLEGAEGDEVFIKVSYDTELCCDAEAIEVTEDEGEFYGEQNN
ncbi:hypothetical protein IMZ31_23880 (plasmid) [Pontibacillus sp. ALD_SL1]|uniref:hypothetical protein n=1 Tax=Pontibacillus sp. ALD_SL1 TaxID=2777185 RepID=UPI001A97C299|nr:hypothetical protein [Pontibacillus sp. ALD_SL1]QST02493.1 hypothetical protein IMZ31_23880 [Pontibacillus sp. ALD_SL1]